MVSGRLMEVWLGLHKACGVCHLFVFYHEQTHDSMESSLLILYNVQKNGQLAYYSLTVGGFVPSIGGKVFKNFKYFQYFLFLSSLQLTIIYQIVRNGSVPHYN